MIALAIIPAPLLALVWRTRLTSNAIPIRKTLLIAATSSYAWLILAMKFSVFLGPTYSNMRDLIIDINFVAMFGCSIAVFGAGNKRKNYWEYRAH